MDFETFVKVLFDVIERVFKWNNLSFTHKFVCIFIEHLSKTTESYSCRELGSYLWILGHRHKSFEHLVGVFIFDKKKDIIVRPKCFEEVGKIIHLRDVQLSPNPFHTKRNRSFEPIANHKTVTPVTMFNEVFEFDFLSTYASSGIMSRTLDDSILAL